MTQKTYDRAKEIQDRLRQCNYEIDTISEILEANPRPEGHEKGPYRIYLEKTLEQQTALKDSLLAAFEAL